MLNQDLITQQYSDAVSPWVRSFDLAPIKCLIVCRGPVRKEAMDVFDAIGVGEYGILLSEKDSIVYPQCLAPELRGFRFPANVHRVPDYMGTGDGEKQQRIAEIVAVAKDNGYTHIFAGYGFMAEDAEFIEAIEQSGVTFMGPSSHIARAVGAKDEAKKMARDLGISVTPGVDNPSALALMRRCKDLKALQALAKDKGLSPAFDAKAELLDNAEALLQAGYGKNLELVTIEELQAEAGRQCGDIWKDHAGYRIRLKYIGGGGGKGQRVIEKPEQVADAVVAILAESKVTAAGVNRNFLIELNIETTRHNEIQIIGNGDWCVSLGGRDCSVQMHEQKLLELSLTRELLQGEIAAAKEHGKARRAEVLTADLEALAEMEREAELLGEKVGLDSVSTFEAIVSADNHYFMEVNTRIQVEHRVTELAYMLCFENREQAGDSFYVDSLIEAMALLALHGKRLPRPTRRVRNPSGAEVRINATNAALQPHAGSTIVAWSRPLEGEQRDDQGIGTPNPDTGAFMWYRVAGAYDSNIALVLADGETRGDNLERLSEILRRTELRGKDLQTNLAVHHGLLEWILGKDAMLKPSTQFMSSYLAAVGGLFTIARDVDLAVAWKRALGALDAEGQQSLKLKQTLILRPLERILQRPHLLGGFLGRHDGKLWQRKGGKVAFAENPIDALDALYKLLNLDVREGSIPSEMIWDHDEAILAEARAFYADLSERLGANTYADLAAALGNDKAPKGIDAELWSRCQSAHAGFQLGLELLLILPRLGAEAGFFDIEVGEDMSVRFPAQFTEPDARAARYRALAPPPAASSDEIVTPLGGAFYSREAPHLPQLVEAGARFEAGQPLFVIEVMKMFNKVSVPFSGVVTEVVLADADGATVKKGQTILKIEPDERIVVETPETIAARKREVTEKLL